MVYIKENHNFKWETISVKFFFSPLYWWLSQETGGDS